MTKDVIGLRTWVDIDTKAIAKNYRTFRKIIGKSAMLMSVVKSNAYGHNIHEFAPLAVELGADWLGVDSLTEALALRKGGIKTPILVLGFTLPVRYPDARRHNISITISSVEQLAEVRELDSAKTPLRVHIKADSGMHRQGFQLHELETLIEVIARTSTQLIRIEGLYTHFAEAKNPRRTDATKRQIMEFEKFISAFREAGHDPLVHASATGGTLLYSQARYDMVRIGIGSYGVWPSHEAKHHLEKGVTLVPALSWKSVVGEVKSVKKGERVGYDLTHMLTRDSELAVVPVGYWHGLPRTLSNKGRVLVKGKSAGIVGRISMDMVVVDVTDTPGVRMGDEVVLIGKQGKQQIYVEELALFAGTSPYEILTRLNPLMERNYI